jgi:hypothetical protein
MNVKNACVSIVTNDFQKSVALNRELTVKEADRFVKENSLSTFIHEDLSQLNDETVGNIINLAAVSHCRS